jgi:hypothetical protein
MHPRVSTTSTGHAPENSCCLITFTGGHARDVNLSREGDVLTAYQETISESMVADQVAILNRSLLLELWPKLILSNRVRNLWESRFPELAATA